MLVDLQNKTKILSLNNKLYFFTIKTYYLFIFILFMNCKTPIKDEVINDSINEQLT